jgi:hypothetical protein
MLCEKPAAGMMPPSAKAPRIDNDLFMVLSEFRS